MQQNHKKKSRKENGVCNSLRIGIQYSLKWSQILGPCRHEQMTKLHHADQSRSGRSYIIIAYGAKRLRLVFLESNVGTNLVKLRLS